MKLRHTALAFGLLFAAIACTAPSGSAPTASPAGSAPDVTVTDEPTTSAGAASPVVGGGFCDPGNLYAEIESWNAGAGHRTATVQLTNIGTAACKIPNLAKPQLVGGDGTVLINGTTPSGTTNLTLNPNDIVSTMVQDANYCGATPTAPVTVAFVFPTGQGGRVVANPVSPDDVDGVPPCNGATQPADIEMHPFAP